MLNKDLVKAAIKKLKSDESDVSGDFTSDCLKSAPDLFYDQLAVLLCAFLTHGYISHDLLVCALSPIVKDPIGDISSSKNYRGIAISSLILKVFDNCLLLLFLANSFLIMFLILASRRTALLFSAPGSGQSKQPSLTN